MKLDRAGTVAAGGIKMQSRVLKVEFNPWTGIYKCICIYLDEIVKSVRQAARTFSAWRTIGAFR